MTAPGALNYPPDMVPVMERFIQLAQVQRGHADETKKIADGLVAVSQGQSFTAFASAMARLLADMDQNLTTATALGNSTISAHGEMMATDRRAASLFE
jgi:uncharacterized protein YukE